MLFFLILFLLISNVNPFLFDNSWNRFFIKTQEIIEPINNKQIKTIEQAKIYNQEIFFIKSYLKDLGKIDYNNIDYNVNNLDELMNKGSMPISSKSGNFCGFIFKFNIPKVDLILGFSLRNKYNDKLMNKPLTSTNVILNKYNELIKNNNSLAANYVMNNWLNKPLNYTQLKENYKNKEINEKKFLEECQELSNCIEIMFDEITVNSNN
tara:strand:+ start:288 stop:914 length:627 start_codon:yes stop_codon:yes gene_type:complete